MFAIDTKGFDETTAKRLIAVSDVNVLHKDGVSALHMAASWDNEKMVALLIAAGAKLSLIDKEGKTPLDYAQKFPAIATLLRNAGAKSANDAGDTLFAALLSGDSDEKAETPTAPATAAPTASQKALDDVDGEGRSALMRATEDHNTEEMARLVKAGASVDIANPSYGGTALFTATWASQLDSMKLLVDAGADVNHLNTKGKSALEAYADTSKLEAMQILIEAGIDREFVPNAIAKAKANGRTEIVDYLSKLPAAVPAKPKAKAAPAPAKLQAAPIAAQDKALYDAVKKIDDNRADATDDNWATIKKLLDEGASAHYADDTGMTTLMMMTRCDERGRLSDAQSKTLVARSDLNAADSDGNTALHYAATYQNRRLVEMLVAAGADLNLLNRNGSKPVNMTISEEIQDYLNGLKNQVAPQTPAPTVAKPITAPAATLPAPKAPVATTQNQPNEIKPNVGKPTGDLAANTVAIRTLLQAQTRFDYATADAFLQAGADITGVDTEGKTPLRRACENGIPTAALWLTRQNIALDAANSDGMTALMFAAERSDDAAAGVIVGRLLSNGADPKLKNKEGKTALDLARAKGNEKVIASIERER